MIWAAIRLHAATGSPDYLEHARAWTRVLDTHYWHATAGGYCTSRRRHRRTSSRACEPPSDDATPNANGIMITNLVHLFLLTGETSYLDRATAIPNAFAADLQDNLVGHCGLLAATMTLATPQHIVIAGDNSAADTVRLRTVLHAVALPGALEQSAGVDTTWPPGSPACRQGPDRWQVSRLCMHRHHVLGPDH